MKFFHKKEKDSTSIVLSGSADKSVRLWLFDPTSPTNFRCADAFAQHDNAINCIATSPDADLFVTGSADCQFRLWRLILTKDGSAVDSLYSVSQVSTPFIPLAIDMIQLDGQAHLLAVAGTKNIIQIYLYHQSDCCVVATLRGHEGWIRSLSFVPSKMSEKQSWLLASASQDKYVRIWHIENKDLTADETNGSNLNDEQNKLSNTLYGFDYSSKKFSIAFEALLAGHEDWTFSANWKSNINKPQLLTSSADNSLAIWQEDPESGTWVCTARLGEASALKGATSATGTTGGFWNGLWSPEGKFVVCLCRTGGWRMWKYNSKKGSWQSTTAISGHTKSIRALTWSQDSSYLLTTSADQTTRLFSKWTRDAKYSWHECARPQIHGYDLNCIVCVNAKQFVSGADEKLLRVFEIPIHSARILHHLSGMEIPKDSVPASANIPVLGLSNKAIEAYDISSPSSIRDGENDLDQGSAEENSLFEQKQPPLEDLLSRKLLWPEREKLYGHGYEISAVATSYDGKVIATTCRATSAEHAVIRLYDTASWREIKPPLIAHTLTVTKIKFSRDDKYLLSVGRDRQWALFIHSAVDPLSYALFKTNPKGHARMILDASWGPLTYPIFATAGRDKLAKIWQIEGEEVTCVATIPFSIPATSIALFPKAYKEQIVVAIGTEEGSLSINYLDTSEFSVLTKNTIDDRLTSSRAVNGLAWKPEPDDPNFNSATLAAVSENASLFIYKVLF